MGKGPVLGFGVDPGMAGEGDFPVLPQGELDACGSAVLGGGLDGGLSRLLPASVRSLRRRNPNGK